MYLFGKPNDLPSTETVDIIEKIVYAQLKPLGFRKHGRTLHRFVEEDISQVVHFQNACPAKGVFDILWVNLGIRVPESMERSFTPKTPLKKYYHEYECNIRTRLGSLVDGKDTYYNLKIDPEVIAEDIVKRLQTRALPVFDKLSNRDAILEFRRDYPDFDSFNHHLILLEEAMIYGRRGDLETAASRFNQYYRKALAKYEHELAHGRRVFLRKGESITYRNGKTGKTETITAESTGKVTLYSANRVHVDVLEKLAAELEISLTNQNL